MKLDEHISSVGALCKKTSTNHLYSQWRNLSEKNKNNKVVKSVDVLVSDSDDLNLDSIHKNSNLIFLGYTKTVIASGGHQDNQFAGVESFINEAHTFIQKI